VPDIPSVGVEEEYLIVDPVSRATVPRGADVLRRAVIEMGSAVSAELTQFQIEAKTPPCTSLAELEDEIARMRSVVAACAVQEGLRIAASGTPILGDVVPPPISAGARRERSERLYGALHDEQSICACHVHVHLPERDRAPLVSNHLRPWLPALVALTANSPYWAGRDTGYSSWRTLTWGRWPVAGPPPYFESASEFEDLVDALIDAGVSPDRGAVYWDIRPCAHLPTLEIRVADMPTTTGGSVLLAAIVRAMVMVACAAVDSGRQAPRVSPELLRAAYWLSARDGLAGSAIDLGRRRRVSATAVVEDLLAYAGPALEVSGDVETVAAACKRMREGGGGAARQRAAFARRRVLGDVVDYLVAETAPPPGATR
jgi:carboxylate-amine ligase